MMRRRRAVALGALAAAVTLTVAVPGSAYAAEGVLIINDIGYENPSGCYPVDRLPSSVANHTDAIAEVHSGADCGGPVEWLVYPGETYQTETAQSVFIL
ncbi:hypothetical protein [Streptomyces griseiscabiei]|uniref:Secreted protein n=1 Tax=Streptomyces griseiscabiei TaxID=2993540 RepID=A0ABU4L048_9ACTN|nr:hypothetical protein [Streptomyces griseiscabiei]MBZ3900858.1 hypothetical protein [Streptomyces griseiscabiei]MDX2909014.1 hypothetical protein [Streptomyces griseiscabiei]